MRTLLLIAACAVQLSAQSGITFKLSIPKEPPKFGWRAGSGPIYLLTVKKSDPRAVDMFSFEVVDAKGKVQSTYSRIDETRIAPIIPAEATEWTMYPFLGNASGDMSVRNAKVVFVGDDDPIVKKRNAALAAGRTFHIWEAMGPPEQVEEK
jgi:hypothetical protein